MAKRNRKNDSKQPRFFVKDGEVRDALHPDKPLRTRRDFLKAGLVSSAAAVTLPSIATTLLAARAAKGDGLSCAAAVLGNPKMPAFFTFDCAGGQAIHSAFPKLTADGGLPSNGLDLLGIGADPNDHKIINDFGLPMIVSNEVADPLTLTPSNQTHNFGNAIFGLSAAIKARLAVVGQTYSSGSDSAANKLVLNSLISASGRGGSLISTNWFGQSNNAESGGNSAAAYGYTGEFRSLPITDLAQLTHTLGFGPALTSMKPAALDRAARTIASMPDAQRSLLDRLGLGEAIAALFGCAAARNLNFVDPTSGGSPDPRVNAAVQTIYGITATTPTSNPMVVEATLVYNTLMGHVPSATLRFGGADYHDMTRTTHDAFQARVAGALTRLLRLADALGKEAFVHMITDGGISMGTVGNTNVAQGDNNETGGSLMFYLPKPGKSRVAILRKQSGVMTDQGVTDRRDYFADASNGGAATHVPLATYLAVAGITDFEFYKGLFKGVGSDQQIAQANKYVEAILLGTDA